MAAGLTALISPNDLNFAVGSRLLAIEKALDELAQIKAAYFDPRTNQEIVDAMGSAVSSADVDDLKGALAQAEATAATWNAGNRAFVLKLIGLGV